MKTTKKLIAILLLAVSVLCLFGCKSKVQTYEDKVVITVDSKFMKIEDDSVLLDYMNKLKEDGQIEFSLKSGLVVSINGIENATDYSKCWMLYTDDEEFSNKAWGEIVVDGKTYYSAALGAESLPIKDGKVYVWGYVAPQW